MCVEPRPSLRIVEDADLVAAEAMHKSDLSASQKLLTDCSTASSTNDALDQVTTPSPAIDGRHVFTGLVWATGR